jgi:acetylornithine aminotransferase
VLGAGQHGSTYGGNPLSCSAALAVLETITSQQLWDNATVMGQLITEHIRADSLAAANIIELRGRGLMLGIELRRDCGELVQQALDQGLLINVTAGNTIRLLPPLVITEPEALELAEGVAKLIRQMG